MKLPPSLRRPAFELTLTSFIVLFQELALIRWLSAEVRVLAYFPNVVLISAFLGLGIGTMRAGKGRRIYLWPVSLAVLVAITLVMHQIAFTSRADSEFLWLLYVDIPNAPVVEDVRLPIVVAFVLTAVSFLTLGQIVGERLQDFSRAGVPLRGYIADLTGSLIGVAAFAVASFYRTSPVVWFSAILVAGALLLASHRPRALIAHVVCGAAIIAAIVSTDKTMIYSPYYAIRTRGIPTGRGTEILVNGSFHQYAAPIRHGDVPASDSDVLLQRTYPVPYRSLLRMPRHVLVLGAGNGNDVAVALDNGAEAIDAVEIDPAIIEIGRAIHPDHPYRSPRVHLFNTDARAFLRNTQSRYDLIVFGTLDSQTRLSALANVRLDNFVYTVDCMRMARSRLAPGGGMALYFAVNRRAIHDKIVAMLTEAFGEPPVVIRGFHHLFTEVFLAGPAWDHLRTWDQKTRLSDARRATANIDVPNDDWPYLYLDSRKIPAFYISMTLIFLAIAAVMIATLAPEMQKAATQHFDAQMFLFGAAFLLLETKLVTQMTLLWGATWITSAVVFASILFMILAGTVVMEYRTVPLAVAGTALIVTLLVTYAIPTEWMLARTPLVRFGFSVLFAGGPIFFASICFAILFRQRTNVNYAFGWNLAGALVGGLIEILAITIGFRALTLVAAAAYIAALLIKQRPAPANAEEGKREPPTLRYAARDV